MSNYQTLLQYISALFSKSIRQEMYLRLSNITRLFLQLCYLICIDQSLIDTELEDGEESRKHSKA